MADTQCGPDHSLSRVRERAGVRARTLRATPTEAEQRLWLRLRNRQLVNAKFRRQHPIGPFYADFVCVETGLVVELDGGQHAADAARDASRAALMAQHGFATLRFWNHEVLQNMDGVLFRIAEALTPALSRTRERE